MKIIVALLSFLNGAYMLADGIFVMLKGKYIGPEKPGPWTNIFDNLNINAFKLGPLFILYGIAWLCFLFALLTHQDWAHLIGIIISVLSLWYFPFGTLISLIVLCTLIFGRHKIGL